MNKHPPELLLTRVTTGAPFSYGICILAVAGLALLANSGPKAEPAPCLQQPLASRLAAEQRAMGRIDTSKFSVADSARLKTLRAGAQAAECVIADGGRSVVLYKERSTGMFFLVFESALGSEGNTGFGPIDE